MTPAMNDKAIECAKQLAQLNGVEQCSLFNDLTYERMKRKQKELIRVLLSTNKDWNQTMLIILFRYIGGNHNKAAAERLARIVRHNPLVRESNSLRSLEALLIGSSGLLDICENCDYIESLRSEFEHLAAKYSIEPMDARAWRLSGMYINNHPILRLAQIAACMHRNSISMANILSCKSRHDVRRLFNAQASKFWVDMLQYRYKGEYISKNIGSFTGNVLGINFVAQMIFAYGYYTQSDTFKSQAIELLEDIPAENNRYITFWNQFSTVTESSLDSQALIQLSREYCEVGRCEECPLRRVVRYKSNKLENSTNREGLLNV